MATWRRSTSNASYEDSSCGGSALLPITTMIIGRRIKDVVFKSPLYLSIYILKSPLYLSLYI